MKTLSCTCGGFVQNGIFVHADRCGRPDTKRPTRKMLREAFAGAWDYEQAVILVRQVRNEVGDAWGWLTPRVQEALIAERCFHCVRARHSANVDVKDMDLLYNAMRVAAGLATFEEVT